MSDTPPVGETPEPEDPAEPPQSDDRPVPTSTHTGSSADAPNRRAVSTKER